MSPWGKWHLRLQGIPSRTHGTLSQSPWDDSCALFSGIGAGLGRVECPAQGGAAEGSRLASWSQYAQLPDPVGECQFLIYLSKHRNSSLILIQEMNIRPFSWRSPPCLPQSYLAFKAPTAPLPSPPSLPACPLPLSCCGSPLFLFQFFLVEFLSFKVFLLPPHAPPNDRNLPEGRLCVLTSPRTLHSRYQWKPEEIMLGKD